MLIGGLEMHFLSRAKLSQMIVILVILPIIAMTYFATQQVLSDVVKNKSMNGLGQLTKLAVKMSNLVHEQQKERGATAVFVGSDGKDFAQEVTAQRLLTDKYAAEFNIYLDEFNKEGYGGTFAESLRSLRQSLSEMPSIRQKVDALSISKSQAIDYYSGLNAKNLNLIGYMGQLSVDPKITSRFIGYMGFLQSKERAGLERAYGASGLAIHKFSLEAIDQFKKMIIVQDTYDSIFLTQATAAQIELYNKVMASDIVKTVENMRNVIIAGSLDNEFENLAAKTWFDAISQKINLLKSTENDLAASLLTNIEQLESAANERMWKTAGLAMFCLILALCLSFFIISNINKSFESIINSMTLLSKGNLDITFPPIYKTEIGRIIKCMLSFKESAIEKVQLEAKRDEDKRKAEAEKIELMSQMANNFDADVGGIVNAVSLASRQLQQTAKSMSTISETTSSNANLVSSASEIASHNVQSVAAASEEMTQSITEINKQVSAASEASKMAVDEVDKTSKQMENLAVNVEKVGGVVALIAAIADQTNLLALNATIEASRAGESGLGFAVVAAEVKDLAARTAQATNEITQHIGDIDKATQKTLSSIEGIGKVTARFEQISTSIAVAVEQQSGATLEISNSAQEAAAGTETVSSNIAEVTKASEITDEASHNVMRSADELLEQSNKLESEVRKFTAEVRATG